MGLQWCDRAMQVTMGRAGRVVIPKAVREEFRFRPGEPFELVIDGAAIRLELATPPGRLETSNDGFPRLKRVDASDSTANDVRALRDAARG